MRVVGKFVTLLLALLFCAAWPARAQSPQHTPLDERLERILDRVGEGVARYQAELFRIAFTETLNVEELRKDMTTQKSKELVFDTIVEREELSAEEDDFYPKTVRRLKTVDGRPAKRATDREAAAGVNVSSLAFLLPKNRGLFQFSLDGEEKYEGRAAYRLRLLRRGDVEPQVEWHGRLGGGRFHAFAPVVFLVWVDAETYDVMRIEAHLVAPYEFDGPRAFGAFGPSRHFKYTNQDYAVRFRRQQFKDPSQTLLVPEWAEWLTVIEGASKPRTRATLRFSDYRRYRSDVKIIEEPNE